MRSGWNESSVAGRHEDGTDAMREWRWRSYLDHLQDMGYDLDGGEPGPEEPTPHTQAPGAIGERSPVTP